MNAHQQSAHWRLTTALLTIYLALCLLIIGLYALVVSHSADRVAAAGTHWYVAPTGADSNDCVSPSTACQSIHTAITKATNSATIHIAAGTYYENLTITKTLTLIGARADLTHVDGSHHGPVFVIQATQPVTLSQITIQQGDAGQEWGGGGITAYTDVTLVDVIVRDNRGSGGGIAVQKPALLTVRNAAILNNEAFNGGGVLVAGGSSSARLTNVTISGNQAANTGGGMRAEGYLELTNVTLADNTAADAAGLWMRNWTTSITNTLIANNNGLNCNSTIGPLQAEGSNLATDTTCDFTAPSDIITNDARLDALGDNGGYTLTHALLTSSPAIDAADSGACPSTDQRGIARPQAIGSMGAARCDIGAFELAAVQEAPTATPTTTVTPQLHNTETPTMTSTPTTESHTNHYFLPVIIEH